MTGFLDITALPHDQQFTNDDQSVIDMRDFIERLRPSVEALMESGLIARKSNIGFAFCTPRFSGEFDDLTKHWDTPERFVWFVGGWGDDPQKIAQYQANAVRKARALLRTNWESTALMRSDHPDDFQDKVESVDAAGNFPWGDYPWSGCVGIDVADLVIVCSVSGLNELEDHAVALLAASLLGKLIVEANNLLPEA